MQIDIELYVSGHSPELDHLIDELQRLLKLQCDAEGQYRLQIIDVLQVPEKAVEHDVFATPTLLRKLPEPIVKVLGRLSSAQKVISVITDWDNQKPDDIIVL